MSIPKVFISYSHDNIQHKAWVLNLATKLCNPGGIDAILDQWELQPGDDIPQFMETNIEKADYILMICTDNYVKKANSGAGGAGYEKMIVTSHLMKNINENKVIPVIRQNGTNTVPTFLSTKLYVDFSSEENFEYSFDELRRTIKKKPLIEKPEIVDAPFVETKKVEADNNDLIKSLIAALAKNYEDNLNTEQDMLKEELNISRIFLDIILKTTYELGFVDFAKGNYGEDFVFLTDEGKKYAFDNNLDGSNTSIIEF